VALTQTHLKAANSSAQRASPVLEHFSNRHVVDDGGGREVEVVEAIAPADC